VTTSQVPDEEVLRAFSTGSREREDEVLAKIYESLRAAALRSAPAGGRQVDYQADSVVQSVLCGPILSAVRRCGDEQHVEHLLRLAVRHKIIDRLRKKKPGSLECGVDGGGVEPVARGDLDSPSAGSVIDDRDGLVRLAQALNGAVQSERDAKLVSMAVMEDTAWEEVASALGIGLGAAKTAMTRLRPRLVGAAVEPLRRLVNGSQWEVVQAVLVDRLPLNAVAETTGLSADRVFLVIRDVVNPLLLDLYGGEAAAVIARLLGRPRG
jgi:DNA-directed RNA polymerase specialized sigma24 family protein